MPPRSIRLTTRLKMPLPNFLIIGAARAGTTSLYRYLAQHPDVYMSPVKETRFFAVQQRSLDMTDPARATLWADTITCLEDYKALFDGVTTQKAIGEASPLYLGWSQSSAAAIAQLIPDVRLIACVRDPVQRAFSHYVHNVSLGLDSASDFDQALEVDARSPHTDYLDQGLYAKHLGAYYARFPPEQIRVYLFEDLAAHTEDVFHDICRFLQIDPGVRVQTAERHNASQPDARPPTRQRPAGQRPWTAAAARLVARLARGRREPDDITSARRLELLPSTRQRLIPFFRDDVLQLQRMLGRDLSAWLRP